MLFYVHSIFIVRTHFISAFKKWISCHSTDSLQNEFSRLGDHHSTFTLFHKINFIPDVWDNMIFIFLCLSKYHNVLHICLYHLKLQTFPFYINNDTQTYIYKYTYKYININTYIYVSINMFVFSHISFVKHSTSHSAFYYVRISDRTNLREEGFTLDHRLRGCSLIMMKKASQWEQL